MHKRHPGALNLYVADEDMTAADRRAWPLAKRGAADLFKPTPFATDPRGRAGHDHAHVRLGASSASVPRMGKTFLLRLLLLICALDVARRDPRLRPEGHRGPGPAAPGRAPVPGR